MPKGLKRAKTQLISTGQAVLVDDLTGGLDLNLAQSALAPAQARVLINWSLEEPGALITVPGFVTHSTTSLGGSRAQGGARIYVQGGPFTLVGYGGDIYRPTDAGVWGSAVLSGRHTTNQMFFPYDRNQVMQLDGSNRPKISEDGTTWFDAGIDAPTVAPTLALAAGGSLLNANDYQVSYTYADTDAEIGHESNESPTTSITVSNPNNTINVQGPSSADGKVDTVRVYARNTTTGQLLRRRVTTVANGGTWSVNFSTEPLDTALEPPTDHDVPEAFAFMTYWKNRGWARHPTTKNRIHFTEVFEPQTWPVDFFIDLPMEKGDDVVAMESLGDTLVCYGQSGVFLIIGQTSLDFEVRPSLGSEAGAFGPRAVAKAEGGHIHAAAEGIYVFDGASDRLLSQKIDKGWRQLVKEASPADLEKIPVVYVSHLKQVNVAVPRLYPTNAAGEWVLDLARSREREVDTWFSTNRAIGGYMYWDGNEPTTGNTTRLFSWGLTTGQLREERKGTTADGSNLVAEYEGPVFTTQLLKALVTSAFFEHEPNSGTLTIEFLVDGATQGVQTFSLGTGLALYGSGLYGDATYAGASRKFQPVDLPLEAEGRNVLVKLKYTGTTRYRHLSYGFTLVPEVTLQGI